MAKNKVGQSITGDVRADDGDGPLEFSCFIFLPRLRIVSVHHIGFGYMSRHLHPAYSMSMFVALLAFLPVRGFSKNSTTPEARPELAKL